MKFQNEHLSLKDITDLKLIAFVLFFLVLGSSVLQANEINNENTVGIEMLTVGQNSTQAFEITSAFIASWEIKEIRDHAVLQVIETNSFKLAHDVTEQLRKFITEPIMVKHGYENDTIVYTIIIGRFRDIKEAAEYHNMLR